MEGEIWQCPLEESWLNFISSLMKICAMDVVHVLACAQQMHFLWKDFSHWLNNHSARIANFAYPAVQLMLSLLNLGENMKILIVGAGVVAYGSAFAALNDGYEVDIVDH